MAIYYIDSYGSDTQLLVKGFGRLLSLAKSSKFHQAAVAVHTKDQVSRSNIWEEAIGKTPTKKLGNGELSIDGCTLYLLTERIDPSCFVQGPILAAAINTTFLNRVIKNRKATDIVFVAWTPEELAEFKRDNPTQLASNVHGNNRIEMSTRRAAEQSLAADGAIACFSSNLFPFSLNADRAPQLKAISVGWLNILLPALG